MPTQVELEKELADLQQKYEQELDAIFTNLYKRVDQIELAPEQPQIEPPSQESEPSPSQSPSSPPSPYTKPPRWRDTWRYQGLKGLLKRAWKGTNPEDDIAWKYSSESIQSRLTLQEYLALNETIDSCLDYYFVIEEISHPEIQKAFEDAKQQIKTLLQRYLLHAHRLGIKLGDLTATDRHMHIPKQQNLFPDIEDTPSGNIASKKQHDLFPDKEPEETPAGNLPSDETDAEREEPKEAPPIPAPPIPEPPKPEKKPALELIPNPEEEQKRIIRAAMTNKSRFDELEPFKPWTWFAWASKPTPKWIMRAIADGKITTEEDDGQKLLKQWEGQAGLKFTEDLEGLTNLFLAIRNGWFGDIEKSDAAVAKRVGTLFDIDKVMGQPWKWLSKNFADQTDIDKYLSSETARRHLMHRQDKAREPAIEEPPVPQNSQERSWKWNPDAESMFGGDGGY